MDWTLGPLGGGWFIYLTRITPVAGGALGNPGVSKPYEVGIEYDPMEFMDDDQVVRSGKKEDVALAILMLMRRS